MKLQTYSPIPSQRNNSKTCWNTCGWWRFHGRLPNLLFIILFWRGVIPMRFSLFPHFMRIFVHGCLIWHHFSWDQFYTLVSPSLYYGEVLENFTHTLELICHLSALYYYSLMILLVQFWLKLTKWATKALHSYIQWIILP